MGKAPKFSGDTVFQLTKIPHVYYIITTKQSSEILHHKQHQTIHRVLQYIRYDACSDRASLERELQRLVAQRFITKEQAEIIDREKILRFFASDLGTKLRKHDNVLREFKFSILNDAGQYAYGLDGEKVLLQGVVDCALLEDDGIIVIDFKTDYVTDDSIEIVVDRYRSQIGAYAEALSRIYQMPVKDKYLYLFHLDRFVQV